MSRREHYLQQHGRGVARESDQQFPTFPDGDVKIIITGSRQYQLHSSTLKNVSPLMAQLLDDAYAAPLTSKAIKKGVVIRHRITAVPKHLEDKWAENVDIDVTLQRNQLDGEGKPINGQSVGLDLENGRAVDPIYQAYDTVFGAFYSQPIELGNFGEVHMSTMLAIALNITAVAEYLGCVNIITKHLEADILSNGQLMHQSITTDPAAWIVFANRIKSRTIFREALIHAVGQYNTPKMQQAMHHTFDEEIVALVNTKVQGLKDGLKTAQLKMLSYYPQQLMREMTVGYADRDKIGRSSYSNDIFAWIALTIFRHFIAQNAATDCTHHDNDMGYAFMNIIQKGGEAYLAKPGLEDFYRLFPMTPKGKSVVEGYLADIKDHVKQFTKRFLENNSQLDIHTYDSQYFTSATVGFEDYPWIKRSKPFTGKGKEQEEGED